MNADAIIEKLLEASASGGKKGDEAARLHTALIAPRRVTLMGPPGVGKANVLMLLAGKTILKENRNLGSIRLSYGKDEETRVTVADGSSLKMDGLPDPNLIGGVVQPVLTEISAPLPALKKISLLQVAEVNDMEGQVKAIKWACGQSDVIIWCTSKFTPLEQDLWSNVPAGLQDHSMILASSLSAYEGDRRAAIKALNEKADTQFAFVNAVDLPQAFAASAASPVDHAKMRRSGASELIGTLLKELNLSREENLKAARTLLGVAAPVVKISKPKVVEAKPAKAEPKTSAELKSLFPKRPESSAFNAATGLTGGSNDSANQAVSRRKIEELDPDIFPSFDDEDAAKPQTPAPVVEQAPAPASTPSMASAAVIGLKDAIDRLAQVGKDFDAESVEPEELLNASENTLTWLEDHLNDLAKDKDPNVIQLHSMAESANDLVQLLRLEGDEAAGEEATTLLLQLKRTFQTKIAA